MKKVALIILSLFFLAACSKEEAAPQTSYVFTDMTSTRESAKQAGLLEELKINVTIREYNESGHNVETKLISNCLKGLEYKYAANNMTDYVTVYYSATYQGVTVGKWIANVIYLSKNNTTRITIGDDTKIQNYEPK